MVYLYYISCLRYAILAGNSRFCIQKQNTLTALLQTHKWLLYLSLMYEHRHPLSQLLITCCILAWTDPLLRSKQQQQKSTNPLCKWIKTSYESSNRHLVYLWVGHIWSSKKQNTWLIRSLWATAYCKIFSPKQQTLTVCLSGWLSF